MNRPGRLLIVVILLLPAALLSGCGSDDPSAWNTTGEPYYALRENFRTTLTQKGPSPQDWEEEAPGRHVREVSYPSAGRNLRAWVFVPDDDRSTPRPALVYCHGGFAGGADCIDSAEPFLHGGYVVMAPTWRAENGNPGDFEMMYGEVEDAVNAVRLVVLHKNC